MRIITSVSPNSEYEHQPDFLRNIDNQYLALTACGRQTLTNNNHIFKCIRKPERCKNFMLQIVLAGKGYHKYNNETIVLEASQCILYEPGMEQYIIHRGPDNADVIWLHFSGYEAYNIVRSIGLTGVTTLTNTSSLKSQLLQMVQELSFPSINHDLVLQNYLLGFLLSLSQRIKGVSNNVMSSTKITPILNHMARNYASPLLTIHEYAQMCYLSDSRFSHLFQEVTGTTPHKYVLQKRIETAENLLANSDMKVAEIATSVGFTDPYHFSRVFKKFTGVSPNTYKKSLD